MPLVTTMPDLVYSLCGLPQGRCVHAEPVAARGLAALPARRRVLRAGNEERRRASAGRHLVDVRAPVEEDLRAVRREHRVEVVAVGEAPDELPALRVVDVDPGAREAAVFADRVGDERAIR